MGSERKFYLINLVGMTGISIEQLDAISCCSGTSAQLCVWQPLDEESCVTAPVLSWTVTMARLGSLVLGDEILSRQLCMCRKSCCSYSGCLWWWDAVGMMISVDFSCSVSLYSCILVQHPYIFCDCLCMKFWVFLRQDITVRFGWGGTADSLVRLDQEWGTELLRQGKVRICTNFKCLSDAMAARERSS